MSCSFLVTSQKSSGASLTKLCSQEGIVYRLQNNSCACKLHFCIGIVKFTPEHLPVSLMWELLYPGFLQLLLHRARKAVSRALLTTWQFNRNQTTTDSTRKKYSFTKHQQTATVSTSDRDFFFFVWNKGELCINSTQSTLRLIELMWLNSLKRDSTSLHSRFNLLIFFLQLEKINQQNSAK